MTQHERVFVRFRGRTIGPLTPEKVKDMVRRGQVTRMHELSGDGLSWSKADEFGNFFPQASGGTSSSLSATASTVPPGSMGYEGGEGAAQGNENASAQWYAHINGEKQGPVSMDQMRLYFEAQLLKKDSLVWKNGMDAWKPASEAIAELFGQPAGGAAAGSGAAPMMTSSVPAVASDSDGGTLQSEMCRQHIMALIVGITLLVLGVLIFVVQLVGLNQGGRRLNSDILSAVTRMTFGGVVMIVGVLTVQAASKMKAAEQSGTMVDGLLAVRSINQMWLVAGISLLIWVVVLLLIVISAFAMGVPVLKVLL